MRIITFIITLLCSSGLYAQIYYALPALAGNPNGYNTPADAEQPTVPGATSILSSSSSPVWSPAQAIPFTFKFNNTTETHFKISNSGVLTFDTSATSAPGFTNASLPSTSIPDKSVMVWGPQGIGSNDNIATKVYGTAPNRQLWIMLLSFSVPGASGSNWSYWSIVLEEGTNNIYIVDQRIYKVNGNDVQTVGIQVNNSTAYQITGSPNLAHLAGDDATEVDNFHYTFMPGPQPQRDAYGLEVKMPNFLTLANAPFTVEAEFMNLGTNAITSADINYKINGGSTVTAAVSNINIATFATATVSSPTTWNPTAGNYNVEVWLSNINGGSDQNPNNDKTSKSLDVVANATVRYSMYETFTSSTCPPCTPANINMEGIFAANPGEAVSLKYQMSWPGTGDPYFTAEGQARRTYYGVNSVPWVTIDGGWNGNGNVMTQAIFDQYQGIPSFTDMTVLYSVSGQTVNIDVMIDPVADINVNDLTLHVAIKEKRTTKNVKTNGETEFFNVMKKMVPNENGTSIPALTQGNMVKKSFSYTFNGSYRLPNNASDPINHATEHSVEEFSDLAVAAWIQSSGSKDVYQAAEGQKVIGIDDFNPFTHNLFIYPNPAKDFATLNIDMTEQADATINVINALGQTVMTLNKSVVSGSNKVTINTAQLASGVYFVNVAVNGVKQTVKLTVQ